MNSFILDAEEQELMDEAEQYQSIMNDKEKVRLMAIADYSIKQRKLKEEAAEKLKSIIAAKHWSQIQAAEILDVNQPRISDLMNNKLDLFKLDMLLKMLILSGSKVSLKIE